MLDDPATYSQIDTLALLNLFNSPLIFSALAHPTIKKWLTDEVCAKFSAKTDKFRNQYKQYLLTKQQQEQQQNKNHDKSQILPQLNDTGK